MATEPTDPRTTGEDPRRALRLLSTDAETVSRRKAFLINLLYVAFWVAVIVLCFRFLFMWMMPFVLAFILAALLQRPLKWLARKTKISKKIFSVIFVVLIVLLIAGIVGLICWQLFIWINGFLSDASALDSFKTFVSTVVRSLKDFIASVASNIPGDMVDTLYTAIDSIGSGMTSFLSGVVAQVGSFAISSANLLISFIVWIVASVFLTIDFDPVINFFRRQIPDSFRPIASATRRLFTGTILKMIVAYGFLMLITFLELTATMLILQIQNPVVIALGIAIIDILPVLGTGTVLIPWAICSFLVGDFYRGIGLLVAYLIITIIRNILEPRVVGDRIGLNPLVTLFCMYLGLNAIGIFGMLLFPIAMLVIVQLQREGYIRIFK